MPTSIHSDAALRQTIYDRLGLHSGQRTQLEQMVSSSPGRIPGKGALDNIRIRKNSAKAAGPVWLESRTVEGLYAHRLDRDDQVICYANQVLCHPVEHISASGRRSVSSAHMDFIVFREAEVTLVECKTEEALEKLAVSRPEWVRGPAGWVNTAYAGFASSLGIKFETFAAPKIFSIELQNLEFIAAVEKAVANSATEHGLSQAILQVAKGPKTIGHLSRVIPSFNPAAAAILLGNNRLFGLTRSVSLDDPEFLLFYQRSHRDAIEEDLLRRYGDDLRDLKLSSELLLASPKSIARARVRLQTLDKMSAGELPFTRKMARLNKDVVEASKAGVGALEACLPNYQHSGNRSPRLNPQQSSLLREIRVRWEKGEFLTKQEAWFCLKAECEAVQLISPGYTTLCKTLRLANQLKRVLNTDGVRRYQKEKPRSDGRTNTLTPLGYGEGLIIDSSKFDQKLFFELFPQFPATSPKFYAAVDAATARYMSVCLFFGNSSCEALGALLRMHVANHRYLPAYIQMDRGPENTSNYIMELCDHYDIELRWAPTGSSRTNGIVENIIKQTNRETAHPFAGSTLPDQKGRAVDGSKKSDRTAREAFTQASVRIDRYCESEHNNLKGGDDNLTPNERRERLLSEVGFVGRHFSLNDDFMILTSQKKKQVPEVEASRGLRITEGTFSSDPLWRELGLTHSKIVEVRVDCIDPSVAYVKTTSS